MRNDNFVNAGRDAQPRRDDGFVLDHGNTGTGSFVHLDFKVLWQCDQMFE